MNYKVLIITLVLFAFIAPAQSSNQNRDLDELNQFINLINTRQIRVSATFDKVKALIGYANLEETQQLGYAICTIRTTRPVGKAPRL